MCSPLFNYLECKIMNPLEPVNLINHCKPDEHANGKLYSTSIPPLPKPR